VFLGSQTQNGGLGLSFYDGLLCVKGKRRFPVVTSSAGGIATTLQPVAKANGFIVSGGTYYFQTWFRDPVNGPCGTTANLSNGLGITFTP
jgi:hypothetical protein